ncbi:MAG: hypothetical protein WC389_03640 [Lutibacter sp.]|jgi:hypothetical protein
MLNKKIIGVIAEMASLENEVADGMIHVGCSLRVNGDEDSMTALWSLTEDDSVEVIALDVPEGSNTSYMWTYWTASSILADNPHIVVRIIAEIEKNLRRAEAKIISLKRNR